MEENFERRMIYDFFGKHFSRKGKRLFGAWLCAEGNSREKEDALLQLWKDCKDASSPSTETDWAILRKKITPAPRKRAFSLRLVWKYAAVVALVAFTALGTWMVKEKGMAEPPAMLECIVPHGKQQELVLPDGTSVWLNSGSMLVYPQSFEGADTRTVYLTGEGGFDVASNPEQPFIVQTAYLGVRALGTSFNVEAYLNEPETMATLEEGSIRVDVQNGNGKTFVLQPDEQLVYNILNQSINIRKVNAAQMTKEKSGYLLFENATFARITNELERRFGVSIQYEVGEYADGRYTIKFASRETLDDAMQVLAELLNIDYEIQGKTVYIRKKE